ncbi:MAG: deoxynucleoside kinase, partial [bacterium]
MGEIIIRRFRHIAIDGVPGLGKTKFAEFLARKIEYLFIGEPVGENPFLNRFYDAKERYAFQTELFFLINRLRLHRKLMYPVLFNGVVTDFTLVRSQIYASINLNEFEYKLYKDFLNELKKGIDEPEAVFFFMLYRNMS